MNPSFAATLLASQLNYSDLKNCGRPQTADESIESTIKACLQLNDGLAARRHRRRRTQYGYKHYTEYIRGSRGSKIILTAPHGGHLKPSSIPNRPRFGCYENNKCIWSPSCGVTSKKCEAKNKLGDALTQELARRLRSEIYHLTGKAPHLVICHLHRSKLDANREINQATFGNPIAKRAYNDFHGFIRKARKAVKGAAILFDIHGQRHKYGWIDLGYVISGGALNDGPLDPNKSSIVSLSRRYSDIRFSRLLRGRYDSFGGLLDDLGYDAVPSPSHPGPGGVKYKRGGYITRKYGSRSGGKIDAIQIESPKELRRLSNYRRYAEDLGEAMAEFADRYY